MTNPSRARVVVASLVLGAIAIATPRAAAQDRPAASILQTTRSPGIEAGTGSAFDRILRQRLDALGVVRVSGQVALDLEQLQIALGCMGETASCLAAVASEVGAQIVLVPSLDHAGEELVATVLLFDARDQAQRRAVRSARGATAEADVFEQTDGLLRELFGVPATEQVVVEGPTDHPPSPAARAGISPLPFVVIGVGVAAIVAGAVVGAISQSDQSAYRDTVVSSPADVDTALSIYSRADTEATVANVLFIAGGVVAAGGLAWLLAAGNDDFSSPLAVAPSVGPTHAGVTVGGSF
jgi:hypothetical protein